MWAFGAICEVTKRLFHILRIFSLAREKADANRAPLPGPCRTGKRALDVQSGRSSGVEHNLAKVGVEGSNPFARSRTFSLKALIKHGLRAAACYGRAMAGLLFALIATLLAGIGARDQVLVAQLSQRQGARPGLLLVAIGSGCVAATLAAWGGAQVADLLGSNARRFLVAAEPTHSLGAFAIVIFAAQLSDAARFLIFALTALTSAPWPTALGGAVGAAVVVATGWANPGMAHESWLAPARRGLGIVLLLIALGIATSVIGAR
jgi:Ca2+/H+ antiporter, TMEM165/GDT1 family